MPPKSSASTLTQLRRENEILRAQLAEAQETLQSLRSGASQFLVVSDDPNAPEVEHLHRKLMEGMSVGAATLSAEGLVAGAEGRRVDGNPRCQPRRASAGTGGGEDRKVRGDHHPRSRRANRAQGHGGRRPPDLAPQPHRKIAGWDECSAVGDRRYGDGLRARGTVSQGGAGGDGVIIGCIIKAPPPRYHKSLSSPY